MTETVTLPRADYEALLQRLARAEAQVAQADQRAHEKLLGRVRSLADFPPIVLIERMLAGESKVRIWREHRRLGLRALATRAGVPPSYLSEIENGHKPGSVAALAKLARALDVSVDELVPDKPADAILAPDPGLHAKPGRARVRAP